MCLVEEPWSEAFSPWTAAAPLRALNSPSLHAVFITVDRAAAPLRAINPTLARIAARFPIVTIRGPSK